MTLSEIKTRLRDGKYAWPGGYPMFFVTVTGDALSFEAVRNRWREIVFSHIHGLCDSWRIAGCDINWEDTELYCEDTGKRIESAYGEDEETVITKQTNNYLDPFDPRGPNGHNAPKKGQ